MNIMKKTASSESRVENSIAGTGRESLALCNIPTVRNTNFICRRDYLENLEANSSETSGISIIHGDGGTGKTALAIEISYLHQNNYSLIWWFRARERITLSSDYAHLSYALNLPRTNINNQKEAVKSVIEWLENNDNWMLIFDDAIDMDSICDFLPGNGAGRIIITSRNSKWNKVEKCKQLMPFTNQEAIEYLKIQTGSEDSESCRLLAHSLANLPIALKLASAYINAAHVEIKALTEIVSKTKTHLSKNQQEACPLTAICSIALKSIYSKSIIAVDLIKLCSFLASQTLPWFVFEKGVGLLPSSLKSLGNMPSLEKNVALLKSFALAERDNKPGFCIPSAVQDVIRNGLPAKETKSCVEVAIRLISDTFPFNSMEAGSKGECLILIPHSIAISRYAETMNVSNESNGYLLNQIGLFLRTCTAYEEASFCYKRSLKMGISVYGRKHKNVVIRINNLGTVLKESGDIKQACLCFERAIAIAEKSKKKNAGILITCLNNLAAIYEKENDLDIARKYCERALSILEENSGQYNLRVAEQLNLLAHILRAQGNLPRARKCLEQALAVDEVACKPEHANWSTHLTNLGHVLASMHETEDSCVCFKKALSSYELIYGKEHPVLIKPLINLGHVLRNLKRETQALELLKRALRIADSCGDGAKESLPGILKNLGHTCFKINDLEYAQYCLKRLLKINEANLGKVHPDIGNNLCDLGLVLRAKGELDEAEQIYNRALNILETHHGPESRKYVSALSNLAGIFKNKGNLEKALALYQQALATNVRLYGRKHEYVGRTCYEIGVVMKEKGHSTEALANMTRALNIFKETLGNKHSRTLKAAGSIEELEH